MMDHRPAEVLFVVLLFFTWLPANVIAATALRKLSDGNRKRLAIAAQLNFPYI
jgi:hypothetical protein